MNSHKKEYKNKFQGDSLDKQHSSKKEVSVGRQAKLRSVSDETLLTDKEQRNKVGLKYTFMAE